MVDSFYQKKTPQKIEMSKNNIFSHSLQENKKLPELMAILLYKTFLSISSRSLCGKMIFWGAESEEPQ